MTYNIRLDTASDGPNRWELRRDLLIGQLRLTRPDILGLQEVVPRQKSEIAAIMTDYAVLGGGRDDGENSGEASPLLINRYRYRVESHGMFWLSQTPDRPSQGWDAAYKRVATWAHLVDRRDGRRVLAINTHWDHVGLQARLESARQLNGWIAWHLGKGEAVVVLGDFNAPLAEASLQTLMAPQGTSGGLRDARAAAREPVAGGAITFNGWDPIPKSGQTIDHLLVGQGLEVNRYHVLAAHFDGRLASDHFAVIADLTFTRSAKDCAARPRASR